MATDMTHPARTVAILADFDRPPSPSSSILAKLARIARYKRNPRAADYMRDLAASVVPGATVVAVAGPPASSQIAGADQIVLLWPDAIGHGWTPVERAVFRHKAPGAAVYALTGRRRRFELTGATLLGLRLRRIAERLCLGEALMALGLLISAPFLVMWDFARGHR